MDIVAIVMAIFSVIGALDRIFGNRLGIGKEFEKGFLLLGELALAMMGMIIITPAIADWLSPVFEGFYTCFGIDPSVIPASLFANDMGGAPLAKEICKNDQLGMYNGMIVASMMGATVSFTIPIALGSVNKENQKPLLLGLLCGIVTIPLGCLAAGFLCGIAAGPLFLNLLPLLIFAAIIAVGLLLAPELCVKIFNLFGIFIKIIITVGLALGVLKFLIGWEPISGLTPIEEAAGICLNAAIVMSGAFPLLFILSKIIAKPMKALSRTLGIKENATLGFVATLANNITTFEMMNEMDKKGAMLNAAFAVSASFVLADHLAFTLAFDNRYLLPMVVGKVVSGLCAVGVALFLFKRMKTTLETNV